MSYKTKPAVSNTLGGQVGAATVVSFTVGAFNADYNIMWRLNVTARTALSAMCQVSYTDETGAAQTVDLAAIDNLGSVVVTMVNTGVHYGLSMTLRAKAGTTITVSVIGSTFTGVTYNVEAQIAEA